ncbi:MAG: SpoIID/LytB domain-containing protein, partial [Clostridiales bacterium]|nr:SpoIID/LytB domain-containing protein [Clostridiales bacterium]
MLRRILAVVVGIMVCINLLSISTVKGATDYSTIRVKLSSLGSPKSITITVDGNYGISQKDKDKLISKGSYTVRIESGKLVLDDKTGSKTVSTPLGNSFTFKRYQGSDPNRLKIGNYYYLGDMEVRLDGSSIQLINHVHLETYLYGVVPYEVSNSWPLEAQKAQAVAARTYAVSKKSSSYYDVVDTTNDQVYRGYNSSYKNCIKAVDETFGKVLKYGNGFAGTFYSASNGGWTEASKNLWPSDLPYTQVKKDTYDRKMTSGQRGYGWTVTYSKTKVDSGLLSRLKFDDELKKKGLKKDEVEDIKIEKLSLTYNGNAKDTSNGARVNGGKITLAVTKKADKGEDDKEGDEKEIVEIGIALKQGDIRSLLVVDSLLFDVEETEDSFKLSGSGWGHGIGMSQWGAYYMAKDGKKYEEILGFYYPGTQLSTLSIETDRGGDKRPAQPSEPDPKPDPGPDKGQQFGRVKVNTSLNVRQGAGTGYKIIKSLTNGTRVEILDRSGAWYKIKAGSTQGYVHGDYIVLEKASDPEPTPTPKPDPDPGKTDLAPPPSDSRRYGTVTASSLNVRSGPGTKNHVVGMVVKGAKLTILGSSGGWYKIEFKGKDAYVSGTYVKLDSQSTPAPAEPVTGKATVTASTLNVRNGAGTSNKIIGSLAKGKQVDIIEKKGSWYKI